MASHDTLEFLHRRLVKDISQLVCKPCTDPRKKQFVLDCESPLSCSCRCATVEPLMKRLEEVEKALELSDRHLSRL